MRLGLFVVLLLPGCVWSGNGQSQQLVFDTRGPFVLGETHPLNVSPPPTGFRTGCAAGGARTDGDVLETLTPSVVDVTDLVGNACGGISGNVHALAVGHGQLRAETGGRADTLDLWVEAPDHVIITGDANVLGSPRNPDVIEVASDAAPMWLALEVRARTEVRLRYVTTPVITVTPPDALDVVQSGEDLFVTPLRSGTATLRASIFGLSDEVTIVVSP